jgi:hypothetical protein
MPHFEKMLDTGQGMTRFYFNRIFAADGLRYHVSFLDKEKKVHMFLMQESAEGWSLLDREKSTELIQKLEPKVKHAIVEHLSEQPGRDMGI